MANVEIVIKIPEELYHYIKNQVAGGIINPLKVYIANGIPLPKGHGKIIDVSDLLSVTSIRSDGSEFTYIPYSEIEDTPAIIETDKKNKKE